MSWDVVKEPGQWTQNRQFYFKPLKLYCDNSVAIIFSNSNSSTGTELYLDTKYPFVRIEENDLCIEYKSTNDMLMDPMTECLPLNIFVGRVSKTRLTKRLNIIAYCTY